MSENNSKKYERQVNQDWHDITNLLAGMFVDMENWRKKIEKKVMDAYVHSEKRKRKDDEQRT